MAESFSLRDFCEPGDTYVDFATGTREIIGGDRVTPVDSDRLIDGEVRFTIRFDPEVWPTLTPEEQQDWIDEANDALADIAQVTYTEVGH